MLNRRYFLVGATALVWGTGIASAADWKSKYPELTFAVVPAENASGVGDRYAMFMDYLSKQLGVPVKLRVANDYAAVIEGQRAGQHPDRLLRPRILFEGLSHRSEDRTVRHDAQ